MRALAASPSFAIDAFSASTSFARSASSFFFASTASTSFAISASRATSASRRCSISRCAAMYSFEFLAWASLCLAPATCTSSSVIKPFCSA